MFESRFLSHQGFPGVQSTSLVENHGKDFFFKYEQKANTVSVITHTSKEESTFIPSFLEAFLRHLNFISMLLGVEKQSLENNAK